jgi:hypothetical protein
MPSRHRIRKCPPLRFVILSNWNSEVILDPNTGLVWEKSPANDSSVWNVAQHPADARYYSGRRDSPPDNEGKPPQCSRRRCPVELVTKRAETDGGNPQGE